MILNVWQLMKMWDAMIWMLILCHITLSKAVTVMLCSTNLKFQSPFYNILCTTSWEKLHTSTERLRSIPEVWTFENSILPLVLLNWNTLSVTKLHCDDLKYTVTSSTSITQTNMFFSSFLLKSFSIM